MAHDVNDNRSTSSEGWSPALTIRYYEAEGLLLSPNRSASGYRVYGPEAMILLRFIRRSKELGLTAY
jgi:DNA-binding transcriptional MerR regulator